MLLQTKANLLVRGDRINAKIDEVIEIISNEHEKITPKELIFILKGVQKLVKEQLTPDAYQ